jgi:hypothetical protein
VATLAINPNLRARIVVAAVMCAAVALVSWPWLDPRYDWTATFDGENHLIRLFLFGDALKAGDWYPRWLPDLAMGYGYPLFNYYAPGMYAVATALRGLGLPIIAAFQWTGVIAVALAATGTYALAHHVMGDRIGAVVAATAFVLAPYPFFTNLYDRAQVPEALALGILPWALLATWRAWHDGGAWVGALGVGVVALLLTHNITSVLASPLIGGVIGAAWWGAQTPWKLALRRVSIGIATGIGMSAFFTVPVVIEASAVHLGRSDVTPYLFDPISTARDLGHAIRSLDWASRAIFTMLPSTLVVRPPNHDTIPIALLTLATLGAMATVVSRTRGGSASQAITIMCAVGVAACLAMNTTWARPVWQSAPGISVIQYAWRLYGPLSLMAALAGAGFVTAWRPKSQMRSMAIVIAAVLIATMVIGSTFTHQANLAASPPPRPDGRMVFARETDRYAGGTTSTGEFLPRTVKISDLTPGVHRGLSVFTDAIPEASWHAGLVRISSGDAEFTAINHARNRIIAEVDATTASTVAFHQFLFPGWRGTIDGVPTLVASTPYDESIHAALGYMVVAVPPGHHRVEVAFGATPPRVIGTTVSLLTLTLGVFAVARRWHRHRAGWATASNLIVRGWWSLAAPWWRSAPSPCSLGVSIPDRRRQRWSRASSQRSHSIASFHERRRELAPDRCLRFSRSGDQRLPAIPAPSCSCTRRRRSPSDWKSHPTRTCRPVLPASPRRGTPTTETACASGPKCLGRRGRAPSWIDASTRARGAATAGGSTSGQTSAAPPTRRCKSPCELIRPKTFRTTGAGGQTRRW